MNVEPFGLGALMALGSAAAQFLTHLGRAEERLRESLQQGQGPGAGERNEGTRVNDDGFSHFDRTRFPPPPRLLSDCTP